MSSYTDDLADWKKVFCETHGRFPSFVEEDIFKEAWLIAKPVGSVWRIKETVNLPDPVCAPENVEAWEKYNYCIYDQYPKWVEELGLQTLYDDYVESNDGNVAGKDDLLGWINYKLYGGLSHGQEQIAHES